MESLTSKILYHLIYKESLILINETYVNINPFLVVQIL